MPRPAFRLRAPTLGTEYHVFVDDAAPTQPAPAVLFLDGDDQFAPAQEAYHAARAAGEVPPLHLFGLGYGASYTQPGNRRGRDYTPTKSELEPESGGADPFLDFIVTKLWPALERRYPVSGDHRGIAGHSLGSLLVLHALFQRRPFFQRFLASAPSVWWDNRAILCTAQNLQRTGVALPARLFLGVGANDTPSMTGDLEMLEQQLAALPFPQLEVISRKFADRDHYNVLPESFRAGLGALFG